MLIFVVLIKVLVVVNFWVNAEIEGDYMDEPVGKFVRPDDTGPFTLPIKKLPDSEKGCNTATKFITGIVSRPSEFIERDFIRHTWGAPAYRQCYSSKLVFLLGNSDDPLIDRQVLLEADKYRDIILLDYFESYINVSRKVYGFIRYVNDHCPNVKCFLKGDSDSVISLSGMEKLCDFLPNNKLIITGKVLKSVGPERDPAEKHYTPRFVWPDDKYPAFVAGFAYMFSGYNIASKMLDTIETKTPFLHSENTRRLWEDTFYGGIIPTKIGIKLNDNHGFQWGGNIGFTWYDNKPLILACEAKDQPDTWDVMQENRGLFFSEFSSQECYQKSFRKSAPNNGETELNKVNTHLKRLTNSDNVETLFKNILKAELLKNTFFGNDQWKNCT